MTFIEDIKYHVIICSSKTFFVHKNSVTSSSRLASTFKSTRQGRLYPGGQRLTAHSHRSGSFLGNLKLLARTPAHAGTEDRQGWSLRPSDRCAGAPGPCESQGRSWAMVMALQALHTHSSIHPPREVGSSAPQHPAHCKSSSICCLQRWPARCCVCWGGRGRGWSEMMYRYDTKSATRVFLSSKSSVCISTLNVYFHISPLAVTPINTHLPDDAQIAEPSALR